MEKWRKNSKWNWASFLLNPVWFGYRKMYAECAIYVGIIILLAFIELLLGFPLKGAFIAIYILNGTLGNKLYYQKAKREMDQIFRIHRDPEVCRQLILQKGGTSGWGIVFGIGMILFGAFAQILLDEMFLY
ncbi:DUF2628 domain-containing protein [Paenibacillus sp. DYY-L-2]|uniref:DUF2628 domain-containing protein n=1 Tax=Paenibacillus sp. DYY-L-2 TaxID=3447013 RepID=UPI003F50B071